MFTDFLRISKQITVVFMSKVIRLVFVTGFETVKERGTFVTLFVEKKNSLLD
jgi:hypothetical protein